MKKLFKGIRMEPLLLTRCQALASERQITFSELIRVVMRKEVGLSGHKANGTKKPRR